VRRFLRSGDSTSKRVLEYFSSETVENYSTVSCSFRMNARSGEGTGSFKVKIRTNTAKFTNLIIARLRCSSKIKPRLRAGRVENIFYPSWLRAE